jgi:hypothetical protein
MGYSSCKLTRMLIFLTRIRVVSGLNTGLGPTVPTDVFRGFSQSLHKTTVIELTNRLQPPQNPYFAIHHG